MIFVLFLVFQALHCRGFENFVRGHVLCLESHGLASIRKAFVPCDVKVFAFKTVDFLLYR